MTASDKRRTLIVSGLMVVGGFFLAYILGQAETFLWGFTAGALVTGAIAIAAVIAARLRGAHKKDAADNPTPSHLISEHPFLFGAGLMFISSDYVLLYVIPAPTTAFILGVGVSFVAIGAGIILRSTAATEA